MADKRKYKTKKDRLADDSGMEVAIHLISECFSVQDDQARKWIFETNQNPHDHTRLFFSKSDRLVNFCELWQNQYEKRYKPRQSIIYMSLKLATRVILRSSLFRKLNTRLSCTKYQTPLEWCGHKFMTVAHALLDVTSECGWKLNFTNFCITKVQPPIAIR